MRGRTWLFLMQGVLPVARPRLGALCRAQWWRRDAVTALATLAQSLQGQGSPQQLEESEALFWEAYNEALKVCTPEHEPYMNTMFYMTWGRIAFQIVDFLRATGRPELAQIVFHE
jgi:hypothetical protein